MENEQRLHKLGLLNLAKRKIKDNLTVNCMKGGYNGDRVKLSSSSRCYTTGRWTQIVLCKVQVQHQGKTCFLGGDAAQRETELFTWRFFKTLLVHTIGCQELVLEMVLL